MNKEIIFVEDVPLCYRIDTQ